MREFFSGLGGRLDSLTVQSPLPTLGVGGETLTAEFTFAASVGGGSVQFTLPTIFVMRVREGQIIESRDYIGPRQA